jgi:arylformamidase
MSTPGGAGRGNPARKLIDVTPVVSEATWVWPGDEPFRMRWLARLSDGGATNLSAITLSPHAGAHVDAPLHFFAGGDDVAALALAAFLGPALVVDASVGIAEDGAIAARVLDGIDLRATERLLLRTSPAPGNAEPVDRPAQPAHLTPKTAEWIANSGLLLLGIDAPSIDEHEARDLPNHRRLAQAGVAVLVGLDLTETPPGPYELIALPLRLAGVEASPVRAVLRPLGRVADP